MASCDEDLDDAVRGGAITQRAGVHDCRLLQELLRCETVLQIPDLIGNRFVQC